VLTLIAAHVQFQRGWHAQLRAGASHAAGAIGGAAGHLAHNGEIRERVGQPDDDQATTTNYIEHPLLVAERIERFAGIVGRERVIAGTDCGFGTFAGFGPVEPDIAYLKLAAMVEGARIASKRLWS
jgi:5-methyltetrahydropteroyltriglutamate--homocysteine methyltransferase